MPEHADTRNVVLNDVESQADQCRVTCVQQDDELPKEQVSRPKVKFAPNKLRVVISSANTTIIGDDVIDGLHCPDPKWLVQIQGFATIDSVMTAILQEQITVTRKCVCGDRFIPT